MFAILCGWAVKMCVAEVSILRVKMGPAVVGSGEFYHGEFEDTVISSPIR